MMLIAAVEAKCLRIEVLFGLFSLWGIAILASLINIPVVIGICVGFYAQRWEAIRSGLAWCRTEMEGGMNQRTFSFVAGVVFGLIALGHALRIVFNLSFVVQGISIPMWASWVAIVVMGYLAFEGFRLARKSASVL